MCSRVYRYYSMIHTLCTGVLVPSRAIHIIRCYPHPESFVLILELKGLNDWFCRRSCWRTCRSGWFSIFWINSRTLVLCAYFTTERGSPGIRKSMSALFTIIDSWLMSWSATDLSVLLRRISSSTLNVSLSWAERVWELSDTLLTSCVITSRPVRSCVCSTLKSFLSSDERVCMTLVSWMRFPGIGLVTGRSVRSEELGSSQKELTSISWERDVFLPSCTPIMSCVISGRPDLSRMGFGVGWFDWKLPDKLPDFWSLSMFWTQFSLPFVFQWDLWRRSRWHVYFFEKDFSSFHSNNFRHTISWKCFLKDDTIRSSFIECLPFKIEVDPIYLRLDVSSMHCAGSVHDVVHSIQSS